MKGWRFLINRVATRRPPLRSSAAVALSTDVNSGMTFPTFMNPILRMFIAAFRSRSMIRPHTLQWYMRSDSFRSRLMFPHFEHIFDEGSNLPISMSSASLNIRNRAAVSLPIVAGDIFDHSILPAISQRASAVGS